VPSDCNRGTGGDGEAVGEGRVSTSSREGGGGLGFAAVRRATDRPSSSRGRNPLATTNI
jgi:hypothetical protein